MGFRAPSLPTSTNPLEPRLYGAVRRVLLAMPDEDFERFFTLGPQIVCQPAVVEGTLWRYFVPVMPSMTEAIVRVIYFCPEIRKWSTERLVRLVAHEIAHLMRTCGLATGRRPRGYTRGGGDGQKG